MRRTRGQEIKRLQKKLIPVNLIVCILCIVAVLSLFFMPVVKINLAALVGDKTLRAMIADIAVEKVNAYIEQAGDSLDGSLGGNGGAENGGEQNNATSLLRGRRTARAMLPTAGRLTAVMTVLRTARVRMTVLRTARTGRAREAYPLRIC